MDDERAQIYARTPATTMTKRECCALSLLQTTMLIDKQLVQDEQVSKAIKLADKLLKALM